MRLALLLVVLALAACGAGSASAPPGAFGASTPTMSSPEEYAERPISAEAGADYFLRTGGGDPYASGLAYPIFLAFMDLYPEILGRDWNELAERFGFYPDPARKGDAHAPPVGFHLTLDPNTGVSWVVGNCQLCHAERLRLDSGDVMVPGLGNKRVRIHAYADALARIGSDPGLDVDRVLARATARAAEWGIAWPEPMRRPVVAATLAPFQAGARRRARATARLASGLPGRVATIESFAIVLGEASHTEIALPSAIGWTKVPDVRSFPFRETFSYDASGYGSPEALVLDADFVFGARPAWYETHPYIATSTLLYLRSFGRSLPFPRPVDAALAGRGKSLFDSRCARCHGFYVDHGDELRVSYRERVVPKAVIGTDPARVDAVTPAYVAAANAVPLARGHARVQNTGGYVPPVLLDVWARGLFGHAGQWPSLAALATPPAERPRAFIVDTEGLYDLERVGVRHEVVAPGAPPRALRKGEYLYRGDLPGYLVDGHPFLSNLTEPDRRAVIEYLKTLSSR
ncbi:MAG: hypothetical protein JWP97_489 [Labilithrix sp.]|nr:hypothetical protein [Labilithrix sp.]